MQALEWLLIISFFAVSIIMVAVILLQNKGGGVSGIFGGSASSQNPFGTQAGDVLAKLTRWMGIIFLAICMGFSALYYEEEIVSFEDETNKVKIDEGKTEGDIEVKDVPPTGEKDDADKKEGEAPKAGPAPQN